MNAKISIAFLNDDTDPQLIADSSNIVQSLTNNPNYTSPSPSLEVISTALENFTQALTDAADGGTQLTLAKNQARDVLTTYLRELSSYVQLTCKGDLAKLMTSGFPAQKTTRTPVGILPAPSVTLSLGEKTGQLDARTAPMVGAAIYNWHVAAANSPTVPVLTTQTTAASNTFSGLTPGIVYQVTANAVSSAGTSDWSDPAMQMVV